MDYETFANWLAAEVEAGRLSDAQRHDLLAQRALFDENRGWIERELRSMVTGFVAERQLIARSTHTILDEAARSAPGRMLYFEPIGYRITG